MASFRRRLRKQIVPCMASSTGQRQQGWLAYAHHSTRHDVVATLAGGLCCCMHVRTLSGASTLTSGNEKSCVDKL
jgi:hypothetical protein